MTTKAAAKVTDIDKLDDELAAAIRFQGLDPKEKPKEFYEPDDRPPNAAVESAADRIRLRDLLADRSPYIVITPHVSRLPGFYGPTAAAPLMETDPFLYKERHGLMEYAVYLCTAAELDIVRKTWCESSAIVIEVSDILKQTDPFAR